MTASPASRHGTYATAKAGCGCEPCQQSVRAYDRRRRRLIGYGSWQPYVDAEPVRAHVRMLGEYGIGWRQVAVVAGVNNGTVTRLMYGLGGQPPSPKVRPSTASRILAVQPRLEDVAPSMRVPSIGTVRRLRALVALGWPQARLASRLGMANRNLSSLMRGQRVTARTALAVRALYDQWWNADPHACGVEARHVAQARARAARLGWVSPLAWDDDRLDDPAARPQRGETPRRGERDEALVGGVAELRAQGFPLEVALARLGVGKRRFERALARMRAGEAA